MEIPYTMPEFAEVREVLVSKTKLKRKKKTYVNDEKIDALVSYNTLHFALRGSADRTPRHAVRGYHTSHRRQRTRIFNF